MTCRILSLSISWVGSLADCLTPKFSCKHSITLAAKPHPKSAWQLQRLLGIAAEHGYDLEHCTISEITVRMTNPISQR